MTEPEPQSEDFKKPLPHLVNDNDPYIQYRAILADLVAHHSTLERIVASSTHQESIHEGSLVLDREKYLPQNSFLLLSDAGQQFYESLIAARAVLSSQTKSFPPSYDGTFQNSSSLPLSDAETKTDVQDLDEPDSALETWNADATNRSMYRILFHEINNFGTMIESCLAYMRHFSKEHVYQGETVNEFPDRAIATLREVISDVRALLCKAEQFSKTGQTPFVPGQIYLNTAIQSITSIMEYEFRSSNIEVRQHYSTDPLYFWGDELRTKQVIRNILLNKVRALNKTEASGHRVITIETGRDDSNTIYARVSDNGPVITQEIDTLFRLNHNYKKGGHGIGLWVCKRIIEGRFRGKIKVSNLEPTGVEFLLTLPVYNP